MGPEPDPERFCALEFFSSPGHRYHFINAPGHRTNKNRANNKHNEWRMHADGMVCICLVDKFDGGMVRGCWWWWRCTNGTTS